MGASRIFLYTVIAFLAGVLLRSFVPVSVYFAWFLVFVSLCSIAIGFFKRHTKLILGGVFLLAFAAGVFRFTSAYTVPESVAERYGAPITADGVVWDEPDIRGAAQQLTIKIIRDVNGPIREPFFIAARTRAYPEYHFGDALRVHGIVRAPENSGSFDYVAYLAKDGIYAVMQYPEIQFSSDPMPISPMLSVKKFLFSVKRGFSAKLDSMIPEPQAGFLSGLLIGERREIPPDIMTALQTTGTMHLVALSGFNISIIADSLLKVLQFVLIPFSVSFWIAVMFVVAFTLMTGASASLVRAAIMGILILVARKQGRMYDARLALAAAAGIMVLHEPGILRFDLGFQLSFLATVGIMFVAPRLEKILERYGGSTVAGLLAPTLGAQYAVVPLLMYAFGTFSIISPLVNICVLAIIPLTMLLGFCAVSMGFISVPLGIGVGIGAWLLLSYEIGVIEWFGHVPFANIEVSWISGSIIIFVYAWITKKIFIT